MNSGIQFFHNINDLKVIVIVPPKAPRTDRAYVASEPLWRIWNPSWGVAALVRPDHHVGWMERRPTLAHVLRFNFRQASKGGLAFIASYILTDEKLSDKPC